MIRMSAPDVAPQEPRTPPSAQSPSAPNSAPSVPTEPTEEITSEQQKALDEILNTPFLGIPAKFRPAPGSLDPSTLGGLNRPTASTFHRSRRSTELSAGPVDIPGNPWKGRTYYVPIPIDGGDRTAALATLGVTGVLLAMDGPIQDGVQGARTDFSDRVSSFIEPFGTEERILPAIGAIGLAGVVFRDRRAKDAIVAGMQAALLSQGVTEAVKGATGRIRPRNTDDPYDFGNSGHKSFFSGHSSGAGAWWHTMAIHLRDADKPKLAILADVLGASVAASRVHDNAHWSSDAFLGYAVGIFSAELVDRWRKGDTRGGGVLIAPTVDFEGNFRVNFVWQPGQRRRPPTRCSKLPDGPNKIELCVAELFENAR